jgi:hypothetical protein
VRHTIRLYYFPGGLRYSTPVLFLLAIYLAYPGYWIISIVMVVVSIFILTAQYVTIIDIEQKMFVDAFSFYWINIVTERKRFQQLDKIILTKGRYEQQLNSRARSTTMRWTEYTATLVYDGHQQLDLVTREDKGDVVEFARVYSQSLKVGIQDLSTASVSRP